MTRKSSGSYGEKLPYKLIKNVSPSDREIAENIKQSQKNAPAVTKNQDVYESVHLDEQ